MKGVLPILEEVLSELSMTPSSCLSRIGAKLNLGLLCFSASGIVCLNQVLPGLLAASSCHFCILKLISVCMFHGKPCVKFSAGGCLRQLEKHLSDQMSPAVNCRGWGVKAGILGRREQGGSPKAEISAADG